MIIAKSVCLVKTYIQFKCVTNMLEVKKVMYLDLIRLLVCSNMDFSKDPDVISLYSVEIKIKNKLIVNVVLV